MKYPLLFTLFMLLSGCFPPDLQQSVIQVIVTKQPGDSDQPWQKKKPFKAEFMGTLVTYGAKKDLGILTTAAAVQEGVQIEGKRHGGGTPLGLKVVHWDSEVNLALLAFTEPPHKSLRPMELGDPVGLGTKVYGMQWSRDLTTLSPVELQMRRVEVGESLLGAYMVPQYFLEGPKDALDYAAPIVAENRLLGLFENQSNQEIQAIPLPLIRRFLKEPTAGVPSFGFSTQRLEDPNLRAYHKIPEAQEGVRITEIDEESGLTDKVKSGDLLLSIAGNPINRRGQYPHPLRGALPYTYLLSSFSVGEPVPISVYQGGKVHTHTVILGRFDSNARKIPYFSEDLLTKIPHLIFGGLVFQELTLEYLRTWGPTWRATGPIPFLYLWSHRNKKSDEHRFVILNRTLSDPFTTGYEQIAESLVSEVNGKKIHSLEDLNLAFQTPTSRKIQNQTEDFAVIRLAQAGGEIILPYKGLEEAHVRLKETWKMYEATFFSRAVGAH